VYLLGKSRGHFYFGIVGGLDTELRRKHSEYSYAETNWLFGGTYAQNAAQTAGGTRHLVVITAGREFDL
jgi:hypothetical protein